MALLDIQAQLEELFPKDALDTVPLLRLERYPSYLRAAQIRLERAVTDPRKDAEKLVPFAPLWTTFLVKRARARDVDAARELRWQLEELRIAIFAPEVRAQPSISLSKVAAALAALK